MPSKKRSGFIVRFLAVLLRGLLAAGFIASTALCQESKLMNKDTAVTHKESSGENLASILQSLKEIKNLSAQIGDPSKQPVMIFSCERILVERKKVGFFRIGILPQVTLQNVKIELWNSPTPLTWSTELARFLVSQKIPDLEFRSFRIDTKNRLESVFAEKASLVREDALLVLQNLAIKFNGQTVHQPHVVIPLSGPKSGQFVFADKPNFRLTVTSGGIESENPAPQ